MVHQIPGISLLLFYSDACQHCKTLMPIFNSLPLEMSGVKFGLVNVGRNKKCIQMSHETIAPIDRVPYIILYYNGKPFVIYRGERSSSAIKTFISDISRNIRLKQSVQQQQQQVVHQQKKIPEYCFGQPVCNDDVCYLDFDEAY